MMWKRNLESCRKIKSVMESCTERYGSPIDILNKDCRRSISAILTWVPENVHATRQVCRPAEKTAGKKTTQQKKMLVTFMQTRDMYLQFTRSNIWANGNN